MAYKSEKQKFFIYKNSTNYAKDKGAAKSFFTSEIKDGQFHQIYTDITDVWKELKDYRQVSTGLNHFRRDVFVIDSDLYDSSAFKNEIFGEIFPIYSYCIVNPESKHSQYGFLLSEPIDNKSKDFKKLKDEIPFFINYYFNKEIVKSEIIEDFADPNFTHWQIKNPFCNEFEVDGDFRKYSITDLKHARLHLELLCNTVYEKENRKETPKEYVERSIKEKYGRYNIFTEIYRKALLDALNFAGKILKEKKQELMMKCREESARLCNKPLEDIKAVQAQADLIYKFVIEKGWTEQKRIFSLSLRKLNKIENIANLYSAIEAMSKDKTKSIKEQYKNLKKDEKRMIKDTLNTNYKTIKQYIETDLEKEIKEIEKFEETIINLSMNTNNDKFIEIYYKIQETKQMVSSLYSYYTKVNELKNEHSEKENLICNTETEKINNKNKQNETLQRTNEQNEELFFSNQTKQCNILQHP